MVPGTLDGAATLMTAGHEPPAGASASSHLVAVGRVGRPHGLRGELSLDQVPLEPLEMHDIRHFTWRGPDGATRPLTLATARPVTGRLLVKFVGIETREDAAQLTQGTLLAPRAALPDPGPGVAYAFQLVGLRVVREDGSELGVVEDVMGSPGQALYRVKGAREHLIPARPEFVTHVDLAGGVMHVHLPPGFEEL